MLFSFLVPRLFFFLRAETSGVGLWARRVRDSWSSRAPNELDATIGHWTMQHRSIEQETKLPFLKLRDIRQVGTRQFLHLLGVVARGELSSKQNKPKTMVC